MRLHKSGWLSAYGTYTRSYNLNLHLTWPPIKYSRWERNLRYTTLGRWYYQHLMNMYIKIYPPSVYYTMLVSHKENYWQGKYDPKTRKTTLPGGKHRPWWKRVYLELGKIYREEPIILRHLASTKGNTMNEEITNTVTEAQPAAPATQLTDAEIEAILASKPIFVTEGDAVEGETIHEGSNVTLH